MQPKRIHMRIDGEAMSVRDRTDYHDGTQGERRWERGMLTGVEITLTFGPKGQCSGAEISYLPTDRSSSGEQPPPSHHPA